MTGVLGAITIGLTSLLANYLKRLGGSDLDLTLMASMPALVAFFALIPGSYLIDKAKNKINMAVVMAFISRMFLVFIALVPLLSGTMQPLAFVLIVTLRTATENLWAIGYQSIVGDVFDHKDLAFVMSARNRLANIAQLVSVFLLAQLMSFLDKQHFNMIVALQIVFIVSALFGFWELYYYRKFKAVRLIKTTSESFIESFKGVIINLPKQKKFIAYCGLVLPFYMAWMFPSAMFNIYLLNIYHANEMWMGYITMVMAIFTVISLPLWHKLIVKYGNSSCLLGALLGMALVPLTYVFGGSLPVFLALQAVAGIAVAGLNLLFFNLLIEMTPATQKTTYIAIFTSGVQFLAFIMPLICVYLMRYFSLPDLMIMTSGFRFAASIWVAIKKGRLTDQKNLEIA